MSSGSTGSNGYYPVVPSDYIQVVKYVSIGNVVVQPFKGATISVSCYTANNQYVYNRILNMNTQEYSNWMNDDSYLVNFVLSQLGLSPAPSNNELKEGYKSDGDNYIVVE